MRRARHNAAWVIGVLSQIPVGFFVQGCKVRQLSFPFRPMHRRTLLVIQSPDLERSPGRERHDGRGWKRDVSGLHSLQQLLVQIRPAFLAKVRIRDFLLVREADADAVLPVHTRLALDHPTDFVFCKSRVGRKTSRNAND